jgi:DNA-binding NtrC family response regulator
MPHALIVDDDRNSLSACLLLVQKEGFSVTGASSLREARASLQEQGMPDVVLLDLVLPDGNGLDLLQELAGTAGVDVVLITGHASVETAIEALRLGALDYLVKPLDIPRFKTVLANVMRTRAFRQDIDALRGQLRQLGRFGPLVGTSPGLQRVYDLVSRVAPTNATVLITGESGTGKELVAQTVHELSRRRAKPFVAVNCGAISPTLIESELFGHERGSFTGADRVHRGLFERASGGTLFLDEVSEMPLELQVKLLRVLETGQVTRVGGDKPFAVDVRVLAATNRDLEAAVAAGQVRSDLLYRLQVFPIPVPPLRERSDDVATLAEHFLSELNRQEGAHKRLTAATVAALSSQPWPGNVRQLKNVIHRAFIMAGDEVGVDCLPPEMSTAAPASDDPSDVAHAGKASDDRGGLTFSPGTALADVERRLILASLAHFGGDKRQTSDALGVSLKTIYNRLREYGAQGAD